MNKTVTGTTRIVCWFSCGVASAVATKLAITENAGRLPIIVAYTEVVEEHSDNKRFLVDCAKWFGMPITILRNEEYNGSIYEVFRRVRFLKGPTGAACTRILKKAVREKFQQPGDLQVFGYTAKEQFRVQRLLDANSELRLLLPLIDNGLVHADCLAMIERAGIEIPAMYKLGYKNNNCIGCVKGEAGYWNKIRVDFPHVFERMALMEKYLGRTVCKVERGGKLTRVSLRDLPPDAGNYEAEADFECSIFCHMAEGKYKKYEP